MAKRQPRPEPFTFEEIRDSPSLRGLEEFFTPQPLILVKPTPGGQENSTPAQPIVAEAASIVAGSATTVDFTSASTVVADSPSPIIETGGAASTEALDAKSIAVAGSTSTVVADSPTTIAAEQISAFVGTPAPAVSVWTAEGIGGVFPPSRRRPIRQAQDVLTHAEEAVYDVLWGKKDQTRDRDRLTAIGYDRLAKAARITKRNVQNILTRLEAKGFIQTATPPDLFHRIPTTYRVLGYAAVLEFQRRHGWRWYIRTGNGIGYARPMSGPATVVSESASTVVVDSTSTVDAERSPSIVAGPVSTVDVGNTPTVDAVSTVTSYRQKTDISSSSALVEATPDFDDDARRQLVDACRTIAPDVAVEEIAVFTTRKRNQLRGHKQVANMVGLLLTAVPNSLEGSGLQRYREQTSQEARQADAAIRQREAQIASHIADCERVLSDPQTSERDKADAREYLAALRAG